MITQRPGIIQRIDQTGIPLLLLRLVLAALFLYLGTKKILDPIAFLKAIRLYKMLPDDPAIYINSIAIVLPWLEVLCGLALLFGVWVRGAGALMAVMLAVFTPAIFLRAWDIHVTDGKPFFEIVFDCGCGAGPVLIWKKLLENSTLFLFAVLVVLSRSRRFCLEKLFDKNRRNRLYCRFCGYLLRGPADNCAACSA